MSFSFEHPNARGVLLPGQTCCHTGKLIRRKVHGDPLADPLLPELCPKLCSPIGVFPKDHDAPRKPTSGANDDSSDEEAEGNKENGVRNSKPSGDDSDDDDDPNKKSGALPLESSPARLAGCAPCGASLKWSCCNACCGPCTLWSKDGFLAKRKDALNPTAREYATWDGCTPIPEDAAAPDVAPRDDIGERLAKVEVGRGVISCIAVSPDAAWLVAGDTHGGAVLFRVDPLVDDLALERVGAVLPRAREARDRKQRSFLDSDDENEVVDAPEDDDDDDDATPKPPTTQEDGHGDEIKCVAFAPDCAFVYTGSRDGTVKQWSVPDLELHRTFEASEPRVKNAKKPANENEEKSHEGSSDVLAVVLSGDGERLYATGARTCVVSWDARTGERLGVVYQGRATRVSLPGAADAESDDESPVAQPNADTSRAARLEREARLEEEAAAAEALITSRRAKGTPANVVRCMSFAPDAPEGDLVITGSRDGAVRRWRADRRSCEREFIAHESPVVALAASSDGGELITGGGRGDGELRHYRWTPVAGVDQEYSEGVPVRRGGAYLRVRTLRSEAHPERPVHPKGAVSVVLSADERFAYSVGADPNEPVVQWNLRDGSSKVRIEAPHKGGVTFLCALPDGVGGKAVPAARPSQRNTAACAVERAAAAAKGGRLITAGKDGFLCVWAVDAIDPVAGATLSARNAQTKNAASAAEFQRAQERASRRTPELSRTDVAVKARKALPDIERAKFPVNPETDEPKDLEDLSVAELERMTAAELITCCAAHGLLVVNPKAPPGTKREIAKRMFEFFEKERAKAKARMRAERLGRR
jgi:WD40 repeat protein